MIKGKIIVSKWLVWPGAAAWACWPFIFVRDEKYKEPWRINHERIHLHQQVEMLVIPFYVVYILNFLINLVSMNRSPYRNILFEKEAFANQDDPNYLHNRRFWAWIKPINR